MQLSYGTNCKDSKAYLETTDLSEIHNRILTDSTLMQKTRVLRTVRKYSKERYTTMKTSLPYFSCSHFQPAQRGRDNFCHATGMILDIDFKDKLDTEVYKKIKSDPRTVMAYISPSAIGIKVLYGFEEPIRNDRLYTEIYRQHAHHIGRTYQIMDAIDFKNSDTSRISFMCHDSEAYINHDPMKIGKDEYTTSSGQGSTENNTSEESLTPKVYKKILKKLESRPKIKPVEPSLSENLEKVIPLIRQALEQYGIEIIEIINIQSGMKLRLKLGLDHGEVNVYHGRKGYSVVSTPKHGTHAQLNESCQHLIESLLPYA